MSGDTVGSALDALLLIGGGLGFARLGWGGINPRSAAAAAGTVPAADTGQDGATATAPPQRPSASWQILSILLLLFGGFIALAGLLLALSLIFPAASA